MANKNEIVDRRKLLKFMGLSFAASIGAVACRVGFNIDTGDAVPISGPVAGGTATSGVEGTTAVVANTVPATVPATAPAKRTVEQSLRDAAENYAKKTNGDAETLYRHIKSIYDSLPADMPFVANGTEGLMPHVAQDTAIPAPLPSKDVNNPSYFVQASMRGVYMLSGGYMFLTFDGRKLEYPWHDKTTENIYLVGSRTENKQIGLYDYAAGGTFGTGVSYAEGQDSQYPDRRIIDKVYLADGVMQAALWDGPGGKTVEVFVDTVDHQVTEYTYDISAKTWSKRQFAMPDK